MDQSKDYIWIPIAFFVTYIVWGSTYLANTWAIETCPPFLMAGFRFIVAGVLVLFYFFLRGNLTLSMTHFKHTFLAGFMFFSVGNGLVVWGLQYVESGITALIIALQPLTVALFMWAMKGVKPTKFGWLGLFIGLFGMAVLIGQPQFIGDDNWLLGLMAIIGAMVGWAYISIWVSTADLPKNVFLSSGFQMLFGGIVLALIGLALGEHQTFDPSQVSSKSLWSLVFLIIAGSIMAFSAFNYLLTKVSPVKVTTSTYINPIIALFLGWWLNNEGITATSMIASGLLLIGVFLINFSKMRKLRSKKVTNL